MSLRTVNDVFRAPVTRNSDQVMLFKQTVKWIPISSRELYRDVVGTARALMQWGIAKGDRVAILSENRPEWAVADFATMAIGAVVVPLYPTLTGEQIAFLLNDSGTRVIFVSTTEQLQKIKSIKDQTHLEHIVVMDYVGVTDAIPMHRLMHGGPTSADSAFDATAQAIGPDDLATIMYTSGTTGISKGVMLTHGNLASNVEAEVHQWRSWFGPGEVHVSFLPLSHVTARHVDYVHFYMGTTIAYCPRIEKLVEVVNEVRPTTMVCVPRVYEKVRTQVETKAHSGIKRLVYHWAMAVGRQHRNEIVTGKTPSSLTWKIANRLLYSKVLAGLGGRVRSFISGGAPLGRELAEWYADIGVRINEGYGLTETSPVIAVNTPSVYKLGTVGRPMSNVEVRIAEDGEILVKGPSIFRSYWNRPEETQNAFVDGWFKTGDVGHIDSDGFLCVTDRKKDLIKTSGGKFIAPQPIEGLLKSYPFVAEASIVGDRRKFPAVIIAPAFDVLEEWARNSNLQYQSRQQLVELQQTRGLYENMLREVNAKLAQFEKIKKFLLISDDFTIANGILTPTMKLRRRVLEERYHDQIENLYKEAAPDPEAAPVSGGR
ncbi:MAG TPA: long-chain fatty acid--CoA ligase [Terriglobales bacterium]|nr:long-chain fatty acid--CoA ligase [Terriglobales bacterium]